MDEQSAYRDMYNKLFNAVTDAERQLREVTEQLRTAQQECEEIYLESNEEDEKTE